MAIKEQARSTQDLYDITDKDVSVSATSFSRMRPQTQARTV